MKSPRFYFRGSSRVSLPMAALWGVLQIPVQNSKSWEQLKFRKLPANQIEFSSKGLSITVKNSASPLIYRFDQERKILGFKLKGRVSPVLTLPKNLKQGEKRADDFQMRLGLVVRGERRLSRMEKWVAPEWILKLYALAPKDVGVSHIEFFNLVADPSLLGQHRQHPKSDVLRERFLAEAKSDGSFELSAKWDTAKPVLALWLSVDGDDLKTSYTTEVHALELIEAEGA